MKVVIIVGVVLVSLGALFLIISKPSDSTVNNTKSEDVSFAAYESEISSGVPLIDVRTPEEFSDGHIQDALNLPLDNIKAGTQPDVEKSEKIYLYCRSGNRSAEAKSILERSGYTNIVNLGGMNEVVALGAREVK